MNRVVLIALALALAQQQQPPQQQGQVKFPVALELGSASSRSGVPGPGGLIPVRPEAGREPKLSFDRVMHEFGEVAEGPEFATEFRFKNEGKGDLKILAEYHHCGCTLPQIEVEGIPYVWGEPIRPNASGRVKVTLRTAGFSGDKPSQVDLYTNDPALGPTPYAQFGGVALRVHAKIRKLLDFEPNNILNFQSISNLEPSERVLILKSNLNQPFKVVSITPDNDPLVSVKAEPDNEEGSRWRLRARIPAGAEFGSLSKHFKVTTDPPTPTTAFYVLGTIRGAVEVNSGDRPYVSFARVARGSGAERQIRVTSTHPTAVLKVGNLRLLDPSDGKAFKGESGARSAAPEIVKHLNLVVHESEAGKAAVLSVELKSTMPAGVFTVRLAFDTGIPGGPETITLPVTGYVY